MMVTCMNDPGTGPTPDPLYNPAYSQFCYEIPFHAGQTQYMDTPVVRPPPSRAPGITIRTATIRIPRRPSAKSMAPGSDPGSADRPDAHIYALGTAR